MFSDYVAHTSNSERHDCFTHNRCIWSVGGRINERLADLMSEANGWYPIQRRRGIPRVTARAKIAIQLTNCVTGG